MTGQHRDRPEQATPVPAERTVAILESFADRADWTLVDLAQHLGYPTGSVRRILEDLVSDGFIHEESGRYLLMPSLLRFALDLSLSFRVPRVAAPHVEAARDASGETAVMLLYDPRRRQLSGVAAAESMHPVRYSAEASRAFFDVHLGASGRAVLAFLGEREQSAILSSLTDRAADETSMLRATLIRDLDIVRTRGWAESRSERHLGVRAVAAPVFGSHRAVIGALLIAWPDNVAARASAEEIGPIAQRAAAAVTRDMGGDLPTRPVARDTGSSIVD